MFFAMLHCTVKHIQLVTARKQRRHFMKYTHAHPSQRHFAHCSGTVPRPRFSGASHLACTHGWKTHLFASGVPGLAAVLPTGVALSQVMPALPAPRRPVAQGRECSASSDDCLAALQNNLRQSARCGVCTAGGVMWTVQLS